MKQTGEFCESSVPRNHTIVQVLFKTLSTSCEVICALD